MSLLRPTHQEFLFPRSKPASEIRHEIQSWAWALPFAANELRHYIIDRKESPWTVVRDAVRREDESFIEHGFEGLQFARDLALGHKMANGLRAAVINHNFAHEKKSIFGIDLTYAANHSVFSDHGIPHWRRMHRLMEVMAHAVPELRHSVSIRRWLNAWMLFPHFHDIDQLLVVFQNKLENKKNNSKKGHALAAAVMIMALTERYMEESGMTDVDRAEARQITAAAALMMMKHDEPEKLEEAFSDKIYEKGKKTDRAKYKATDIRYMEEGFDETTRRLVEDFKYNKVDLFTLSPHQIMRILREQKKQVKLVDDNNNPYGLYKPFYDEYMMEISRLYLDMDPLLGDLTSQERKSFILATEAAVIADEMEMIYPPYPSILRSLKTPISIARPWWKSDNLPTRDLYENIKTQGGNYEGSQFNCDVRRLLWEAWNSAQVNPSHEQEFSLKQSAFVKKTNKEHIIMRILALKEFGRRAMMNGQDNSFIDHIYEKRLDALSKKVSKRAKLNSGIDLIARFEKRKIALRLERENMREIITRKSSGDQDENALRQFEELCDLVLKDICEIYGVKDREIRKLSDSLEHNTSAFYETYDPLGGLPDTLLEPENPQLWTSLLLGEYSEEAYVKLRSDAISALNSSPKAG